MKILGQIRWLKTQLYVSLVERDGPLFIYPWAHLAYSSYDKRFYGCKILLSPLLIGKQLNIYSCVPLSKKLWIGHAQFALADPVNHLNSTIPKLAPKLYKHDHEYLESEFEYEFYHWPFWACGGRSKVYNVCLLDLNKILDSCIRRINSLR